MDENLFNKGLNDWLDFYDPKNQPQPGSIKNYFPDVPNQNPNNAMSLLPSPYYSYSGQGNLFSPRGYAQNTLIDLLSTRGQLGETPTEETVTEETEATQPTFQEVKDSDEQSFFNGMDVNEGDSLDFDSLSGLSLTEGLFGGTTVSDNAPRGWNTQHQREFDALVAAGLKPKAKWTGNDWYVYAPELKGTAFGEPGTMSLSDTISSGSKYKGQGFPSLFAGMTGSFNADEVFKKNLAEALKGKVAPPEEISIDDALRPDTDIQTQLELQNRLDEMFASGPITPKDEGSVTAKRGGTVTAKEGGTVTAKRPKEAPKPKSLPLKEVIKNAVETLVPKQKPVVSKGTPFKEVKNREGKTARETVKEVQKEAKMTRKYGF
jgi:hypothetical protein